MTFPWRVPLSNNHGACARGAVGIHQSMSPLIHYESGDSVSVALADADPALGAVINRVGVVSLSPPSDPFVALIRSIVGQQLSERAASVIFGRLSGALDITPKALASADEATLRAVGLSRQKSSYVQEIARRFLLGDFGVDRLKALPDEDAMSEIMRLRGVGPWSAEMFLMFALGRPDVLAVHDLGVRAQAGDMMGLGRPASRDELAQRAEAWKPHRSAASFYLMASRVRSAARPVG
jgi:DNA-3-methyladenine glycosylase II